MNDKVRCKHCDGLGVVPLTGKYADTLKLLRLQKHPMSGADLARLDGCQATAMNNRLAALERMGLARSVRYGRVRRFYARKR